MKVIIMDAYLTLERAIVAQFGPAIAGGWIHSIVAFPGELDGLTLAGTIDGRR